MHKRTCLILLLSVIILFSYCSNDDNPVDSETPEPGLPRLLTQAEIEIISAGENFGLKFFKEVVNQDENKNIFLSPLSVSMALGMTLNGANGQTEEDMKSTLEFTGMSQENINSAYKSLIELLLNLDSKVIMELANSIWYRYDVQVLQDFIDVNRDYFDAEVRSIDFSAVDALETINGWVYDETNGKIEDLIDQFPANIVMYLINAIYFKGTWKYQFDQANTSSDIFRLSDGSEVSCQMMNLTGALNYTQNSLFQAVDLPYGVGNYFMTILLPRDGVTTGDILDQMNTSNWDSWINGFSEINVDLSLPKFRVEYDLELSDVLSALGMGVAFQAGAADFTGIRPIEQGDLWINRVLHKTFVEVNEEGTEAAAATAVEIIERSGGTTPLDLKIDHPFIFAIRENNSGTILFIGKIENPAE
ncbi:serpin family protein [candidate division KSB1 bacterium]